jgi:hypothetical protein
MNTTGVDETCLDREDSMDVSGDEENTKDSSVDFTVPPVGMKSSHGFTEVGGGGGKYVKGKASDNGKTTTTASHLGSTGGGEGTGAPSMVKSGIKRGEKNGKEHLTFKPQYYTIKATRERKEKGLILGSVGEYGRGETGGEGCGSGACTGFDVAADCRQFAAKNFHDLEGCRNISSSIDHDGLKCLACANPHSLGESMCRGEPVVVCISDQNFPPVLPADDGKCVVVIRVEEGRLFEIEGAFRDVFIGHCTPHGRFPLVGSLSHLGRYGLESYAVDLVKTMASVAALVGGGVSVVPYVPIPLGGIDGGETIRALFDLDSWLLGTCPAAGALLEGARSAFWGVMARAGVGGRSAPTWERIYHLPGSAVNPRRKPFWSPSVATPLPKRLPPLGEDDERTIVRAILDRVAGQYGVAINCNPSLERGMAILVNDNVTGQVIIVGASHMCRMAEFVPMNYILLAYPGFRTKREGIDSVAEKLKSLVITENDTVILDLVSNVAFMGTDKDGLPTPSIKGGDGKYHVPGVLTTAPPTTLKKNLEGCNAIAEIIKMANVILMCPTPRYVLEKCCNDPAHIENHSSMDFDDEIVEYQEQHRHVLGGWATTRGLEFCIMDPTAIVNPTEPLLRNRVTSAAAPSGVLATRFTCRGRPTRTWRWRSMRPTKARAWWETRPLSARAVAILSLAPGLVARPMALKRDGFLTPLLPCQCRLRRSVAVMHGPLLPLAGYVVGHQCARRPCTSMGWMERGQQRTARPFPWPAWTLGQ